MEVTLRHGRLVYCSIWAMDSNIIQFKYLTYGSYSKYLDIFEIIHLIPFNYLPKCETFKFQRKMFTVLPLTHEATNQVCCVLVGYVPLLKLFAFRKYEKRLLCYLGFKATHCWQIMIILFQNRQGRDWKPKNIFSWPKSSYFTLIGIKLGQTNCHLLKFTGGSKIHFQFELIYCYETCNNEMKQHFSLNNFITEIWIIFM